MILIHGINATAKKILGKEACMLQLLLAACGVKSGKWPASITMIRHGESEYNELRGKKAADPLYKEFKRSFIKDIKASHPWTPPEEVHSPKTRELAQQVYQRYTLAKSDHRTLLNERGHWQARQTGAALNQIIPTPDTVLVSPYERTLQTFRSTVDGGFDIGDASVVYDNRIREQEHGLVILHSDKYVYQTFYPEQRQLLERTGRYWYQHLQGESVPEVEDRLRSLLNTLTRDYTGMHVTMFTHHLTILAMRTIIERLTPKEFVHLDENETPVNLGVTMYKQNPDAGKNGKLELAFYNRCLWT